MTGEVEMLNVRVVTFEGAGSLSVQSTLLEECALPLRVAARDEIFGCLSERMGLGVVTVETSTAGPGSMSEHAVQVTITYRISRFPPDNNAAYAAAGAIGEVLAAYVPCGSTFGVLIDGGYGVNGRYEGAGTRRLA